MLNDEQREAMRNSVEGAYAYHLSLGATLRNQWGLWKESVLVEYFHGLGIMDAEAMSAIVIETYLRQLRGQPLDIEKQIAIHKQVWDSQKPIRDAAQRIQNQSKNEK